MFRVIFRINKNNKDEMFALKDSVANQLAQAEMIKAESKANCEAEKNFEKDKNLSTELIINSNVLEKNYPQNHNAILHLIKNCETTIIN